MGADIRLGDAKALDYAGAEILYQNVNSRCHAVQQIAPLGPLQFQGNGTLVAVIIQKTGGKATLLVGRRAHMVAAAANFHLDDIRPLVPRQSWWSNQLFCNRRAVLSPKSPILAHFAENSANPAERHGKTQPMSVFAYVNISRVAIISQSNSTTPKNTI